MFSKCPFCEKQFLREKDLKSHLLSLCHDGKHNIDDINNFLRSIKEKPKYIERIKQNNHTKIELNRNGNDYSINRKERKKIQKSKKLPDFEAYKLYENGVSFFKVGNISNSYLIFHDALIQFETMKNNSMIYKSLNYTLFCQSILRNELDIYDDSEEFLSNIEISLKLLQKFKSKEYNVLWLEYYPKLLMDKIWFFRKHNDYYEAKIWAKERLQFAEKLYQKSQIKFSYLYISSLKMYFECNLRILKQETTNYKLFANFHQNTAKQMQKLDFQYAINEWAYYYKYKALENVKDSSIFKNYIDLSIEWARKNSNSSIFVRSLEQIKYNRLEKFSLENFTNKIAEFEKQKDIFFKQGKNQDGLELLLEINMLKARNAEKNKDFESAKYFLKKAVNTLKKGIFESNHYKIENIEKNILIIDFKLCFSSQKYLESLSFMKTWLELEIDQNYTVSYFINRIYFFCAKLFAKKNELIDQNNLNEIEEIVKKNEFIKVQPNLIHDLRIFIIKNKNKPLNSVNYVNIIVKVTNWIVGPKIAAEIERVSIFETRLSEMDWILDYPGYIQERYQNNIHLFNDIIQISEANESVLLQMYKLLEKVLEIYLECKSKQCWRTNWESKIEDYINKKKDRLTFGEYIKLFHILYEKQNRSNKNIEDALKLLDKHLITRNRLTHEFTKITPEQTKHYFDECTQILFLLHSRFPVCGKIEGMKEKEFQVKVIWNKFPNIFRIHVEKAKRQFLIKDKFYYFLPRQYFEKKEFTLIPVKTIFSAYFLPLQLNIKENYKDFMIFSANSPNLMTKFIYNNLLQANFLEVVPSYIKSMLDTKKRKNNNKILGIFLDAYGRSYRDIEVGEENIFLYPANIFLKSISCIEKIYGNFGKQLIIKMHQSTLSYFFKNLLFGIKRKYTIFPSEKYIIFEKGFLRNLINDFNNAFEKIDIVAPSEEDIIVVCCKKINNIQTALRTISLLNLNPSSIKKRIKNGFITDWTLETLKIVYSTNKSNWINLAFIISLLMPENYSNFSENLKNILKFIDFMSKKCQIDVNIERDINGWIVDSIIKILSFEINPEIKFTLKNDIINFIQIFKEILNEFNIFIDIDKIINNLIQKTKRISKKLFLNLDSIINGRIFMTYKNILKSEDISGILLEYFNNSHYTELNFGHILDSFLYLLIVIVQNNTLDKTIKLLEKINGVKININYLIDQNYNEDFLSNWITNTLFSLIRNKNGLWGDVLKINSNKEFDIILIKILTFFDKLGINFLSIESIKALCIEKFDDYNDLISLLP